MSFLYNPFSQQAILQYGAPFYLTPYQYGFQQYSLPFEQLFIPHPIYPMPQQINFPQSNIYQPPVQNLNLSTSFVQACQKDIDQSLSLPNTSFKQDQSCINQLPQNNQIEKKDDLENQIVRKSQQVPNPIKLSITKIQQQETKNIPKNFAKAIITYILQNPNLCSQFFTSKEEIENFLSYLRKKKNLIASITMFQQFISTNARTLKIKKYNEVVRAIGYTFVKKNMVNYIFNSKVKQQTWHLKYRRCILKALECPENFNQVKVLD